MPTIEVSDEQYDRLDALREELAAEFVGDYGSVRHDDAVEYLLDRHGDAPVSAAADEGDGADTPDGADGDSDDADGGEGADGEDRLAAMMSLLDEHDDKWRETDAEEGNYEVDLPDGGVEIVRTKDDVRAVLFGNY
ncbi:MAG: hypothetical protein ABEH77_06360 [Halobacteriaceae archaeon]